jgi:hypothetical protein
VRFLQDARESFGQRGQRRRVDLERDVAGARHRVGRHDDHEGLRLASLDGATGGAVVRETARRDAQRVLDEVAEATGRALQRELRDGAGVDRDRQQHAAAAVLQQDARWNGAELHTACGAGLQRDLAEVLALDDRGDRQPQQVTLRDLVGQLRLEVERQPRLELRFRLADASSLAGGGVGVGLHEPGRHRIARREADGRLAVLIGRDDRVPEDRRREVRAAFVRRLLVCVLAFAPLLDVVPQTARVTHVVVLPAAREPTHRHRIRFHRVRDRSRWRAECVEIDDVNAWGDARRSRVVDGCDVIDRHSPHLGLLLVFNPLVEGIDHDTTGVGELSFEVGRCASWRQVVAYRR